MADIKAILEDLDTMCGLSTPCEEFEEAVALGDSPLEAVFIGALLVRGWHSRLDAKREMDAREELRAAGVTARAVLSGPHARDKIVFGLQATIPETLHRGRVDLVAVADEAKIIVELDGLKWHSSPERFIEDRRRDRRAQYDGWTTLRFASVDVFDDPIQCAHDVICSVEKAQDRIAIAIDRRNGYAMGR